MSQFVLNPFEVFYKERKGRYKKVTNFGIEMEFEVEPPPMYQDLKGYILKVSLKNGSDIAES